MARRIQFEGTVYEFPDDATDEEVARLLTRSERNPQEPIPPPPDTMERLIQRRKENASNERSGGQPLSLEQLLSTGLTHMPVALPPVGPRRYWGRPGY